MYKKSYLQGDGFIILDKTYNLLNSHKKFKDCIKDKNLYNLLENFNNSSQKKQVRLMSLQNHNMYIMILVFYMKIVFQKNIYGLLLIRI